MKILRSMFRSLVASTVLLSSLCAVQHAYAASGVCMPDKPGGGIGNTPNLIDVNFTKVFSNPLDNYAGKTEVDVSAGYWSNKPSYIMTCDCDNPPYMGNSYIRAVSPLPQAGFQVNGLTGYILNDYLAISSEVYIAGGVKRYLPIPLQETPNNVASQNCQWVYDTGANGKVHLYFRRPFVGKQTITPVTLLDIFISSKPNSGNSTPAVKVMLSGSVTVAQSCVISPDPITIDFGDIMSSKLKTQGAKPDGFLPVNKQLTLACQNISDGVKVDLSFSAEPDPNISNALKTTNGDIAVMIKDGNGNIISPVNGTLPVNMSGLGSLNSTGQAEINVYPVNTTGKTPAVGVFNATGTVKVEIQ